MEIEDSTEKTELEPVIKNQNKVTVGFKCHPEIKMELLKEATQLDISLSEYVESLVLNRNETNKTVNPEIERHIETINKLKQKIAFYENNLLINLYNAHQNEIVSYINNEGKKMELKINELTDFYTILINSFKINKP